MLQRRRAAPTHRAFAGSAPTHRASAMAGLRVINIPIALLYGALTTGISYLMWLLWGAVNTWFGWAGTVALYGALPAAGYLAMSMRTEEGA